MTVTSAPRLASPNAVSKPVGPAPTMRTRRRLAMFVRGVAALLAHGWLSEIGRQRFELGVADLGLAEEGHHVHTVAHGLLYEVRRQVGAILECAGLRVLVD